MHVSLHETNEIMYSFVLFDLTHEESPKLILSNYWAHLQSVKSIGLEL